MLRAASLALIVAAAAFGFSRATDEGNALSAHSVGDCPSAVAIPREMHIGTRYIEGDRSASQVDERANAREAVARQPISRPVSAIIRLADGYLSATGVKREQLAQCLQAHFLVQARNQAMMGATSQYDNFYREWMVGALAIAYAKARTDLLQQPGASEVQAWFVRSAKDIKRANEDRFAQKKLDNHSYWGALATLIVGKNFDEPELVNFGRKVREKGLSSIRHDGSLLAELQRRELSLHYHIFAATPLAASIYLDHDGVSSAEKRSMSNLASYISTNVNDLDEGPIAFFAGVPQRPEERPVMLRLIEPFLCEGIDGRNLLQEAARDVNYYQFLGGDVFWLTEKSSTPCN